MTNETTYNISTCIAAIRTIRETINEMVSHSIPMHVQCHAGLLHEITDFMNCTSPSLLTDEEQDVVCSCFLMLTEARRDDEPLS